jgi:hypothetical protein
MQFLISTEIRSGRKSARTQAKVFREKGFTLLIVLLLISLMLGFVLANSNGIYQLRREVKLLEVRQQKHWEKENARATNGVPQAKGVE